MALINLDWDSILNKEGWVPDETGEELVKSMAISPQQLGMFNWMEIKMTKNRVFALDLHCNKYAPNKDTMDFMAHCYHKWGNDSFGRGVPCEADVINLKNGRFIRSWDGVMLYQTKRPENSSLTIALHLVFSDDDDMADVINAPFFQHEQNFNAVSDSPRPPKQAQQCIVLNKPLTALQIILCVFLSLFVAPIGTIGVFIYGLLRYVDKSAKVKWVISTNIRDNRKSTIPASPEVIAINKRNGKIAIIISLVCAAIFALTILTNPTLMKTLS